MLTVKHVQSYYKPLQVSPYPTTLTEYYTCMLLHEPYSDSCYSN